MYDYKAEGITAITLYVSISLILVLGLFVIGLFNAKVRKISKDVFSNYKIAAVITFIYFIAATIGSGLSFISIVWSVGLFGQSMVGLSIARSISNYQLFPIFQNKTTKRNFLRAFIVMIFIGVIASFAILISSIISMGLGNLFGEARNTDEAISLLPKNGVKAFFALLAGAGIIEGITYRMIVLSLLLKLLKHRFLAIVVASVIFSLYHFTPLNIMYKIYWQLPVTQFVYVLLGGIVIGYIYTIRGFETSVLSHTFADWLPLIFYIYLSNNMTP